MGVWLLCRIVCDSIEALTYYEALGASTRVNVGPWPHSPEITVTATGDALHIDLYQRPVSAHITAMLADAHGEIADRIIAGSIGRWGSAAA